MDRPNWCPHKDCIFKCHSQMMVCVGVLAEPSPHDGDINTHRFCLHGDKDDGEWTFDLKVNKSDVWNITRILNCIAGSNKETMSAEIFKIYATHASKDEYNIGPIIGFFSNRTTAELFGQGKGWFGGNGSVTAEWAVKIDGKYYHLVSCQSIDLDRKASEADAMLKQQILASLTPDQKRVLGLS